MSKILVLGCLSFRGRTLSLHIIKNNLASKLLLVDKLVPQASFLTQEMEELFEPYFLQADIARPEFSEKVFAKEEWEYVYNMIADIPCNQDNSVYRHGILNESIVPATMAMKSGSLKCWVQISSYEVYKSSHEPKTEDSPIKPCSNRGRWFAKTESELQKIKGLPLIILRTASTWGPYCVTESLIWAVMGDIYKYLGEPIPMIGRPETRPGIMDKQVPIFNLADKHDMNQGHVEELYNGMFQIQAKYFHAPRLLFRIRLEQLCDEVNDHVMETWNKMLREANIKSTPICPYMDSDLFGIREVSIDGSRIERVTGFEYDVPHPTLELALEFIDSFISRKLWPRVIGPGQVERFAD